MKFVRAHLYYVFFFLLLRFIFFYLGFLFSIPIYPLKKKIYITGHTGRIFWHCNKWQKTERKATNTLTYFAIFICSGIIGYELFSSLFFFREMWFRQESFAAVTNTTSTISCLPPPTLNRMAWSNEDNKCSPIFFVKLHHLWVTNNPGTYH